MFNNIQILSGYFAEATMHSYLKIFLESSIWYKRGIYTVGNLVNENYKMLSFENLNVKYNLNSNILNVYTIR